MTVVEWLESPKGEKWSRAKHQLAHADTLVSLKDIYPERLRGLIWYIVDPAEFVRFDNWEMI